MIVQLGKTQRQIARCDHTGYGTSVIKQMFDWDLPFIYWSVLFYFHFSFHCLMFSWNVWQNERVGELPRDAVWFCSVGLMVIHLQSHIVSIRVYEILFFIFLNDSSVARCSFLWRCCVFTLHNFLFWLIFHLYHVFSKKKKKVRIQKHKTCKIPHNELRWL